MSQLQDNRIVGLIGKLLVIDAKLGNLSREDRISYGLGSIKTVLSLEDKLKLEQDKEKISNEFYDDIIAIDRINIRKSPNKSLSVNLLRNGILKNVDPNELYNDFREEIFEYHQDYELIDRATFIVNYFSLVPPYVNPDAKIPKNIQDIYRESRWCFVYCQYNATIALSRTVIESAIKYKLKIPDNMRSSAGDVLKIAVERKFLSDKAKWRANIVINEANKILHRSHTTTKQKALDTINYVLEFIEEIYL